MKRPFLFALLALLTLTSVAAALAAPPAGPALQEQRPVIAQPPPDGAVRGVVQVVGTATHPQFQRYELYYAPWPVPGDSSWVFIGDAHFNQQPLGLLATWDSRSVPDGAYGLRVRVVKADGNYIDSDARRVIVANSQPAETPTPAEAPTSEPFPTEIPPTEAAVVDVATAGPTNTPEIQATPTLGPEDALLPTPTGTRQTVVASGSTTGDSSVTEIAGQLFGGAKLMDTAKKAATYTVALFLAIGVFFGVKALLVWLWYKIRP
jgi:hypothetical protein